MYTELLCREDCGIGYFDPRDGELYVEEYGDGCTHIFLDRETAFALIDGLTKFLWPEGEPTESGVETVELTTDPFSGDDTSHISFTFRMDDRPMNVTITAGKEGQ